MIKNRWFGHVEINNNNDIIKKIDEIREEENRGRHNPKKQQIWVIWQDMIR